MTYEYSKNIGYICQMGPRPLHKVKYNDLESCH